MPFSGPSFGWEDLEVVTVDADGEPVRVVSPSTLYHMKRDTVRPKDRIDAEALRPSFDLEDD
jgi:hypothetical protein